MDHVAPFPPIVEAVNINLTRSGEVRVRREADHTYQCGTTEADRFFYRADLTIGASDLDARGWVVDHADIDAAFRAMAWKFDIVPSCELLAAWLCQCCVDLVGAPLRRVQVQVSGDPDSRWMSATWERQAS